MEPARAGGLLTYLSQVADPRGRLSSCSAFSRVTTSFAFRPVDTAVVCSLLCGARGYEGLVEWLHDLPVDIWHGMGFPRRPPQKDAFRDLLIQLAPAELDRVLQRWVVTDLGLPDETKALVGISIDGKRLCATLRPSAKAVPLLAAVDHQTGSVLSQTRVDEKTNEHKGGTRSAPGSGPQRPRRLGGRHVLPARSLSASSRFGGRLPDRREGQSACFTARNRAGIHRRPGGTVFRFLKTGPPTPAANELLNNKQRTRWTRATVALRSEPSPPRPR